ncbi:MAG: hypothetical protein DI603_19365 [Roseateles depolymerans]|uniref:RND transporter n=1 Tax=Roseateles depolymerans TaxID=76731 RepID=A0A2W5D938_9BURK|nr:MAG: hypothetical protein DI603_19365 [Roseateles depolymerans]
MPLRSCVPRHPRGAGPLLAALTAALLSACVAVPPEPHAVARPTLPAAQLPADLAAVPSANEPAWPAERWWRRYGDAQLDALLELGLQGSPSLQAAAARIGAAHAALTQARAADEAEPTLAGGVSRERYSSNGLFPAPIGGATFNDFSVQLQGRKTLDLWGGQRARVAAAVGEEAARRAELAQSRQLLAAAIVQTYWELQSDWALAAEQAAMAGLQQQLVEDRGRRVAHGLLAQDDQLAEQQQLAALKRREARSAADALQQREALRALLGAGADALADLVPRPLPAGGAMPPSALGFELLARRADLQAARWRAEASMSRVEVAQAAFYPQLDLGAAVGLDSLTLPHLLRSASRTFTLAPGLSLPVFSGAALRGQLGSARSERDERVADYDQQVLDAVRDVAQAVAAQRGLQAEAREQARATAAVELRREHAQRRLSQGLSDRASLLQAELAGRQEREAALQLQREQLRAEVALVRALGGGVHTETEWAAAAAAPSPTPSDPEITR